MSALAWITDLPVTAVQVAVLGLVAAAIDRWLLPRDGSAVREVLWSAVLLRLLLPARWFELPLAVPWAGASATAGAAVPWQWFSPWLLGSATFTGLGWLRYRRRIAALRATSAPAAAGWQAASRVAAARLRVRAPALCATTDVAAPCVVGVLRPCVFVPSAAALPLDHLQRVHVLLHEFAHVRRRDAVRAALVLALQVLFFWHPIVWLAARRLRLARELGADALAVAAAGDAPAYGHTLLACSRPARSRPPAAAASMASGDLRQRVEALVDRRRAVPRRVVSLLLLLVAAPLAAAATSPGARDVVGASPGCLLFRYQVLSALAAESSAAR